MSETEKKAKSKLQSKIGRLRRDKNARLVVIILLMAIVVALFFFWGKFKAVLIGLFLLLLVALGLETTGNDWDLGRLIETGSFEESRVERTESGIWMIGEDCSGAVDYNCDDFSDRGTAQAFFEQCGGVHNDISRLDGDGDGEACESLPE